MRKIGFSHGDSFKLLDVNTEKNIQILAGCGGNSLEINCHTAKEADSLDKLLPYIKSFERLSIHAPVNVRYVYNQEIKALLKKLEYFYNRVGAELLVIHPDLVDDWSVFDDLNMNLAIENMDDRKQSFKDVGDLKDFFDKHPEWSLVLDLGHCKANDKSMVLAENMILAFRNRIVEIHLSGYKKFHEPLHRTKQKDIIAYCKDLLVPIIIESVFEVNDGFEGLKKELDYILQELSNL
ncbi:MAG: hypothetical protein WCK59_00405 [Candidatus Falkowbacteria bacterium]